MRRCRARIVSDGSGTVLARGTDENGPLGHGWTYSAHPIGAAAGVANLKLLDSLGLVANAGDVGPYLTRTMAEALGEHANVGEVRGEGMLSAVELVKNRDDFPANTVDQRAWMRDLVTETGVDHALHVLDVADDVCLARLHARNAAGEHPFKVTDALFHAFSKAFAPPTLDEGFTIVTHRHDG
jgi:acetylornithine/succinyldiaminopimelate/putrescine aminotransferase